MLIVRNNKHLNMMITLVVCVSFFALANSKPQPMENVLKVVKGNEYLDHLLASIRTDPDMSKFDPLSLPYHRRDELIGFHIMNNGTATGLSTLHRHAPCTINMRDDFLVIRANVVTNHIQVIANLLAQKNSGENVLGKIYGTIQMLSITIEISIDRNGAAQLSDYLINSIIYLEPENFMGKATAELSEIVHNAMYYSFSFNYGYDIGRIVSNKFKDFIERAVFNMKFPIEG